jgi:hypothetical protein
VRRVSTGKLGQGPLRDMMRARPHCHSMTHSASSAPQQHVHQKKRPKWLEVEDEDTLEKNLMLKDGVEDINWNNFAMTFNELPLQKISLIIITKIASYFYTTTKHTTILPR